MSRRRQKHLAEMYDYPDVQELRRTMHRAKYAHKCACCDRPIKPRGWYEAWVGVIDGEFIAEKRHADCVYIMKLGGDFGE